MTSSATIDPASTAAPSGTVRITPASAASSISSPASGAESADGGSTGIVQLPNKLAIRIPRADHGKLCPFLQSVIAQGRKVFGRVPVIMLPQGKRTANDLDQKRVKLAPWPLTLTI